jgi:preprotein translocase subunit YajC
MFCGGMIGTVANVKDTIFSVKVADNVKIEVARGAILRVLDKDEVPGDVDKNA